MVWLDGQGLRKNTNGNLVIKKSGEEVCRQTSLSEQKTCRYLCPINAHQKVTLAEEDFNNQVDRLGMD